MAKEKAEADRLAKEKAKEEAELATLKAEVARLTKAEAERLAEVCCLWHHQIQREECVAWHFQKDD